MKPASYELIVKDDYIKIKGSSGYPGSISFVGDRCGEQQKWCRSFVKAFKPIK